MTGTARKYDRELKAAWSVGSRGVKPPKAKLKPGMAQWGPGVHLAAGGSSGPSVNPVSVAWKELTQACIRVLHARYALDKARLEEQEARRYYKRLAGKGSW